MEEDIYIFKPNRMSTGMLCVALIVMLAVNIYLLTEYNSIWLYVPLVVLSFAFVIFIFPVIKNQRIILSGKKMYLFVFGQPNEIDIEKDLKEVVVRRGEVVSYRFEKDGTYFQISPASYHDHMELKGNLEAVLKLYNISVRVVSR